jgi:hypothetical protein
MSLPRLFLAGLLFAAAVSLAAELARRDRVGVGEYLVGLVLFVALALAAFRMSRRAMQRT